MVKFFPWTICIFSSSISALRESLVNENMLWSGGVNTSFVFEMQKYFAYSSPANKEMLRPHWICRIYLYCYHIIYFSFELGGYSNWISSYEWCFLSLKDLVLIFLYKGIIVSFFLNGKISAQPIKIRSQLRWKRYNAIINAIIA